MRWSVLLVVGLAGCATVQRPLSAKRALAVGSAEAVVNHLSQTAASGELCDARAGRALLANGATRQAVIDAFAAGAISEHVFERCVTLALETLAAEHATAMLDKLVLLYEAMLSDEALEHDGARQGRLGVVHRRLLERPNGVMFTAELVEPRLTRLRGLIGDLGPVRRSFAEEVLEGAELEAQRWQGAPVDVAVLDGLLAAKAERTLLRATQRLPDERLRDEAVRRLVRLRLSTSAWSHLNAGQVEETVLRYGTNPIDVPRADIEAAHLERNELWGSTVAVHQPWGASFHELRAPADGVLPTMHLRNVVWAKVKGFERPITVCESGRPLDPTPCLPESSVSIESPVVTALGAARYDFRDDLPLALSMDLAGADRLRLPVHLDGEVMGWLDWKMRYLTGDAIEFPGGAALAVRAKEQLLSRRVVFEVDGRGSREQRVVEPDELAHFEIVSRGTPGAAGRSGTDGQAGVDGAECGNGGDGTDGFDGGPGGDGGRGGDIAVAVACVDQPCGDATLEKLRAVIQNVGGAGGRGGFGGSGGRGGAAGPSRPATTHLDADGNTVIDSPGCSGGSPGSSGRDGASGADGRPGAPGQVVFREAGSLQQL